MLNKGWRLSFSVVMFVLLTALAIKWFGPPAPPEPTGEDGLQVVLDPAPTDVRSYFPALQDMSYHFSGEGMEYAAFTRQITFSAPGLLQIENLSGTNLVQVVEYSENELKVVWSEEEFYTAESLLDEALREDRATGRKRNLVLLQAPVVKGHTWSDEDFQREIIAIDETVIVPLGTFREVVMVKSQSVAADDFVIYEYYAKNIGLIKRVSLYTKGEATNAIISSLNSLNCPPPQF